MSMGELGAISYFAVAALYAVLVILLLTGWRGRRLGGYLIAACSLSMIWGLLMAASMLNLAFPVPFVFSIEVLRSGAWLAFLAALGLRIGVNRRVAYAAHLLWIGVLLTGMVLWFGRDYFGPVINMGSVLIPGGLLMALAGLMLIEQLYRNSPPESRWGLKALAIGVGGLFAYDLFLYSQGLLFNAIDPATWIARGAANVLFVPMIAIAVRRSPEWHLDIFVSRQIVFYTTTLIAVGLYLLLMSLGGYALLIYGGSWGAAARVVFFVGAAVVLLVLLFSSSLRARARVFLSKHFFRNKYDYREEWLRLISTLGEFEDSSTRQVVIKSLAQIVGSPSGLLWVLNDGQKSYELVANYNAPDAISNIPVDDALVGFVKDSGWLIDLQEYVRDPGLYGNITLPDWLTEISNAWLLVPLTSRQELIGLIMLTRAPAAPTLNYEDRDLLKTVGNHIAVHLVQEKSDSLLAEAQQFEAYNRLTAFLMHDLNNLIAQQSLIVKNAERHKRNPEFVDDAIETIKGSVDRMNRVMRQLKREDAEVGTKKSVELRFIVSRAVENCSDRQPAPSLRLDDTDLSLAIDSDPLQMVITHLIRNAQDATPPSGRVNVILRRAGHDAVIEISDTGSGMSAEFIRDRLFKPFDSTKGAQGMGIGAYQAREFARRHGGDLQVSSDVSAGTTMLLTLPSQA